MYYFSRFSVTSSKKISFSIKRDTWLSLTPYNTHTTDRLGWLHGLVGQLNHCAVVMKCHFHSL